MNNEFIKDLKKNLNKTSINSELSPGSKRRYEPVSGIKKHNERIHKESAISRNKNLPFSFRKPPTPTGRPATCTCSNCGEILSCTTATVAIICYSCGKFSKVLRTE